MLIYKIFRAQEWATFIKEGVTDGAPMDQTDGFVHFSTAVQAAETATKHFTAEDRLMVLALKTEVLAPYLKWVPSRGGALFPHLYRRLTLADVFWSKPLPLIDGQHQFPEEMI
ncbi:MAG: DUF952 domain-containing protein [Paracoccaceae bacterium]|nr:DUF952 domain-containing protein [Paracoccaceae bacterium]